MNWILLVEDNVNDATFVEEALNEIGCDIEVRVVRDGAKAEELLDRLEDSELPALVLLDLNLPSRRGDEVLRGVRKAERSALRRIPIVMMSSSRSQRDIDNCYEAHANSYIVKPLELEGYFTAVQSLERFWLHTASLPT